jgi:hypothetical protein
VGRAASASMAAVVAAEALAVSVVQLAPVAKAAAVALAAAAAQAPRTRALTGSTALRAEAEPKVQSVAAAAGGPTAPEASPQACGERADFASGPTRTRATLSPHDVLERLSVLVS